MPKKLFLMWLVFPYSPKNMVPFPKWPRNILFASYLEALTLVVTWADWQWRAVWGNGDIVWNENGSSFVNSLWFSHRRHLADIKLSVIKSFYTLRPCFPCYITGGSKWLWLDETVLRFFERHVLLCMLPTKPYSCWLRSVHPFTTSRETSLCLHGYDFVLPYIFLGVLTRARAYHVSRVL